MRVQVVALAAAAIVLFLLLIVLPGVLRGLGRGGEIEPAAAPAGTFRPTAEQWRALGFAQVGERGFEALVATEGRIATDDDVTVQVTPPFSGRVVSVSARLGDHVAKGQALLSAEAAEVAQARSDFAAAEANLKSARAQLATAGANAARQQALFRIGGNALKDVQQSAGDLAAAQGTVAADAAALAAVRGRLAILDVGPEGGGLASLDAPISGVVTMRAVGPGQYLNATSNGATAPIFTVSDLSKVWLVAQVREDDAGRMRVGLPIRVRVMALPGRSFDAVVDYVAPALDPTTRRLTVRAALANPEGALKPEMFADFAIRAGAGETAASVPQSAVIYEGDQARVWIARSGRTLALRRIRAGRTLDGQVEVLDGLSPGDQVVTSGAIFIDRAAKGD